MEFYILENAGTNKIQEIFQPFSIPKGAGNIKLAGSNDYGFLCNLTDQ